MKQILIFLLFFVPFVAHTQADYPVIDTLRANDFTLNITGFSGFNGGTVAHNAGLGTMTITASTTARGAIMSNSENVSTKYQVAIKAQAGTASQIYIYGQWANIVATLNLPCDTIIQFTSAAAPGGFGSNLIIAPVTAGTVEIDDFRMFRVREKRLVPTRMEVLSILNSEIKKKNLKASPFGRAFSNDFAENSTGVSAFAGSISVANGYLTCSGSGNNLIIVGSGLFADTCVIRYRVKVEIVDHPIILHSVWGTVNRDTIRTSGEYTGFLQRNSTSALNGFAVQTLVTGGTIKLDHLEVEQFADPLQIQNKSYLKVGYNITGNIRDIAPRVGINIKEGPGVGGLHTTLGSNVNNATLWTRFFSPSYTTGEGVTIGNNTYNASARTTAIGEESVSVGQSGMAIGSGAENYTTHGMALGRGAFNPNYPHPTSSPTWDGGGTIVFEPQDLYGSNGKCHMTPEPISGQSRGSWPGNTGRYFAVHGIDAFDARHPAWSSAVSYSVNDIVHHNDSIWFSKNNLNLNSTPSITNTANWYFWLRDNQGATSEYNVPGAPLKLVAGLATGSGESSSVQLVVGRGNNGPNTKDSERVALEVRSEETITAGKSYAWLYDPATSTMKQILIKAKPASSGTQNIIGFNRLSL